MRPTAGDVSTGTVLFTDIIDSTSTRVKLGEETATRVFARHGRLLRAAARSHRALFTRGKGDGIMAVFASAAAALKAALAIEYAVAAENRDSSIPFEIRLGISSGDIEWTSDDIDGLPVVEAARLCAVSSARQVLCSELVVRLSCGR